MKFFISSMHWILTKPVGQTTSLHLCLKQLQRALQNHWINCSLSLSKGKFPKLWKTAGIVPIPKSTNKNKSDPTEYRPISLLSIVSKLLGIIFHSILWEHLVEYIYVPISDMQWGFQKSRCTTSLLLHTIHDWFTLLDQQMEIMCFFDFKRAFDTVPHRKL